MQLMQRGKRQPARILPLLAVVVTVLLSSCKLVYRDFTADAQATIYSFRLTNEDLSGWSENPGAPFKVYIGEDLRGPIDGGADKYLERGLIQSSIQSMQNAQNQQVEILVLDFGDPAKATIMYEEVKSSLPDISKSGSFEIEDAFINKGIIGGCDAYAHYGSFYFELKLTGYEDQNQAIRTADLFLRVYDAKSR